MNNRKTLIRFFTISDYEEEEIWLRSQHQNGWKLVKMIVPCFFIFESCTPEDVVYRLDYKNNTENSDYFQIFRDYGWEYVTHCTGWLYFRKPVSETDMEQDTEIFSDDSSRIDMVNHIVKTRSNHFTTQDGTIRFNSFVNPVEVKNKCLLFINYPLWLQIPIYLYLHK